MSKMKRLWQLELAEIPEPWHVGEGLILTKKKDRKQTGKHIQSISKRVAFVVSVAGRVCSQCRDEGTHMHQRM